MFDFKLTKSGDIEDSRDSFSSSQKITFSVSPQDVQRLSFLIMPAVPKAKKKGEQEISFRFTDRRKNSFTESSLQDDEEASQALLINLKTELGDTYGTDVGSSLYKLKHAMVKDDADFEELKDRASAIVRGFLPDATVKLVKEEYPDAGYFRYAAYVVEVYDEDLKVAEIPIF